MRYDRPLSGWSTLDGFWFFWERLYNKALAAVIKLLQSAVFYKFTDHNIELRLIRRFWNRRSMQNSRPVLCKLSRSFLIKTSLRNIGRRWILKYFCEKKIQKFKNANLFDSKKNKTNKKLSSIYIKLSSPFIGKISTKTPLALPIWWLS